MILRRRMLVVKNMSPVGCLASIAKNGVCPHTNKKGVLHQAKDFSSEIEGESLALPTNNNTTTSTMQRIHDEHLFVEEECQFLLKSSAYVDGDKGEDLGAEVTCLMEF